MAKKPQAKDPVKLQPMTPGQALRAALSIPDPHAGVEGAQKDWNADKGGGRKKEKPQPD